MPGGFSTGTQVAGATRWRTRERTIHDNGRQGRRVGQEITEALDACNMIVIPGNASRSTRQMPASERETNSGTDFRRMERLRAVQRTNTARAGRTERKAEVPPRSPDFPLIHHQL